MPILFSDSGCEKCRKYWTDPFMESRDEIMEYLVKCHDARQAHLLKCNICHSFWEEPNGAYPTGLSKDEVSKFYGKYS